MMISLQKVGGKLRKTTGFALMAAFLSLGAISGCGSSNTDSWGSDGADGADGGGFGGEQSTVPTGYSSYAPPTCPDNISIQCNDIDQNGDVELCNAHQTGSGTPKPISDDPAGQWQRAITIKIGTKGGTEVVTYPIPLSYNPAKTFTYGNNPALTPYFNTDRPGSDTPKPDGSDRTVPPLPDAADLTVSYSGNGDSYTTCTGPDLDAGNKLYDSIIVQIGRPTTPATPPALDPKGETTDPQQCTYKVRNRCDWVGPKAAQLNPRAELGTITTQDNSLSPPYKSPPGGTACSGQFTPSINSWDGKSDKVGTPLDCTGGEVKGGGYATFIAGNYPYSQQYGLFLPTQRQGSGADPSCKPGDRAQCAYPVTSEYNCKLRDGVSTNDLLGDQGARPNGWVEGTLIPAGQSNYVAPLSDWKKFMNKGGQATYDCLQLGTVNGQSVCITRQYPLVAHGTYGQWPDSVSNPSAYPAVPTDGPMTGACANSKWSPLGAINKAIVLQQRTFVKLREACVKGQLGSDTGAWGCMAQLPPDTYFDAQGKALTQALLSIGHGTMNSKCGDITLASNGNNAILQMSTGTRSWSFEIQSPSGSWLACESPAYYKGHKTLCDAGRQANGTVPDRDSGPSGQGPLYIPPGTSVIIDGVSKINLCPDDGTQGIQPWVQRFDFNDLPSTAKFVTLPVDK